MFIYKFLPHNANILIYIFIYITLYIIIYISKKKMNDFTSLKHSIVFFS